MFSHGDQVRFRVPTGVNDQTGSLRTFSPRAVLVVLHTSADGEVIVTQVETGLRYRTEAAKLVMHRRADHTTGEG